MPRFHLVSIGANHFASSESVRTLHFAESDAVRVARAMSSQRAYEQGEAVCLSQSVFVGDAIQSIQSVADAACPDDHLVVFFAGHGIIENLDASTRLFLGVHGTRLAEVGATAISLQLVLDVVRDTAAKSCVVILDCCFSGRVDARSVAGPRYLADLERGRRFKRPVPVIRGEGRILIGAAGANESANESSTYKAGVFTHHMLTTLYRHREGASLLSVSTLLGELENAIHAASGGRQLPVLRGENHGASLPTILDLGA